MEQYRDFAEVYDALIKEDVDYVKMADYLLSLCNDRSVPPKLILDLGCGTGSLMRELYKRGIDVIGVDVSENMLDVARNKLASAGDKSPLLLCQNMCEFELYGTVDCIFCMTDSLNYVTEKSEIRRVFRLAHNYLNPGGVFIFDLNTIYKLCTLLGNNSFVFENEDIFYVWQNEYENERCTFFLDFFVKAGKDKYKRISEEHLQRGYEPEFLKEELLAAGFSDICIYDGYTRDSLSEKSERLTIVCSKK